MALKDVFDASSFSAAGEAFDLFGNSIRKGFSYDGLDNKIVVYNLVQVLTDPQPLSKLAASSITGTPSNPADDKKIVGKWVFKGRIRDQNSPHDCLPDPCNLTYARDPAEAERILNMHTTYISEPGMKPKKFSFVKVEHKLNVFGPNMQYGRCTEVTPRATLSPSEFIVDATCESLKSIMDSAEFRRGSADPPVIAASIDDKVYNPMMVMNRTSKFGERPSSSSGFHYGIDLAGAEGVDKVWAIANGTVYNDPHKDKCTNAPNGCVNTVAEPLRSHTAPCKCGGGWGNHVIVEHWAKSGTGQKVYSIYAHLAAGSIPSWVKKKGTVGPHRDNDLTAICTDADDKTVPCTYKFNYIGKVGNTGNSRGAHLHMEVRLGQPKGSKHSVDPEEYINMFYDPSGAKNETPPTT